LVVLPVLRPDALVCRTVRELEREELRLDEWELVLRLGRALASGSPRSNSAKPAGISASHRIMKSPPLQ
jgi:hypothetical protein